MNDESKSLKDVIPYLFIGLIGLATYFQALFFGFTFLDDNLLILENSYWLRDISNFWQAFRIDAFRVLASTPSAYSYYRPLATLSFMFDAQWGGMSAFSFHFTNVFIHLAAASLLFSFLLKLNYKKGLAYLGALIFTVHPAIASAVVWIPGRNDSLLAVFALASFIFFIDYLEKERVKDGLLSLIFFFLALLTKESALLLILFFCYYLRFMAKEKLSSFKIYFLTGGWALAAGCWFFLRQGAMSRKLSPSFILMLKALSENWPAVIQNLGKIFFPFNLAVTPTIRDTTMLYGYLAVVVIILLLIFTRVKRYNFITFGLLWFLLFFLPTLMVFYDFQLEHRLYLPIIGIIILLLETEPIKKLSAFGGSAYGGKGWGGLGVGLALCLLAAINFTHSRGYTDPITFWRSAVRSSPRSALAHLNLGVAYFTIDEVDAAEKEYYMALELEPTVPELHNDLGVLYLSKKRWREAEIEFKKELALRPDDDLALYNLGVLCANLGKLKLAEDYWKKAAAINPENLGAYLKLAAYYYQIADYKRSAYYVKLLDQKGIKVNKIIRTR